MKKLFYTMLVFCLFVCQSFAIELNQSIRLKFINEAYRYLKTPYQYGGDSKKGMDCSGLIYRASFDSLNIVLPRNTAELALSIEKTPEDDIQPGDILFFSTVENKISHAGIYIGNGEFIHSASQGAKTGVIISSLTENYWHDCYKFAGRILPKEDIFKKPNE